MKIDAALNRTRAIRSKISAECAHDPEKLVNYYLDMQKKLASRMVAPKKRAHKPQPHKHMRAPA